MLHVSSVCGEGFCAAPVDDETTLNESSDEGDASADATRIYCKISIFDSYSTSLKRIASCTIRNCIVCPIRAAIFLFFAISLPKGETSLAFKAKGAASAPRNSFGKYHDYSCRGDHRNFYPIQWGVSPFRSFFGSALASAFFSSSTSTTSSRAREFLSCSLSSACST